METSFQTSLPLRFPRNVPPRMMNSKLGRGGHNNHAGSLTSPVLPLDFASTQPPVLPINDNLIYPTPTPHRSEDLQVTNNEPTFQAMPSSPNTQLGAVIGDKFYPVHNPNTKYQQVCRNHLLFKCHYGSRCYRLHIIERPLPKDHLDIVLSQSDTICITTADKHLAEKENATAPLQVDNEPIQPVVKLPPRLQHALPPKPQHSVSPPELHSKGNVTNPTIVGVSMTTAATPVPHAQHTNFTTPPPKSPNSYSTHHNGPSDSSRRPPPTTKSAFQQAAGADAGNVAQVPENPTSPPKQPKPPKIHEAASPRPSLTAKSVSRATAGVKSTVPAKMAGSPSMPSASPQPKPQESVPSPAAYLPLDKFYSEIYVDDSTGFWGWKPDNDAWDDTGQSSISTDSSNDFFADHNSSSSSIDAELPDEPVQQAEKSRKLDLGKGKTNEDEGDDDQPLCREWVIHGRCQWGARCKFSHNSPPGIRPKHIPTASLAESVSSRLSGGSRNAPPAPSTVASGSLSHRHPPSESKSHMNGSSSTVHASTSTWNVRVLDHIKMKIGPGFVVQGLTTGFETSWVLFEGIPSNVSTSFLSKTLNDYGRVIDVRPQGKKVRVKFGSAKEAQDVMNELNGSTLFDRKISARLVYLTADPRGANGVFTDTAAWITWEAPGKIVYGGYGTRSEADRAMAAAAAAGFHATPHTGLPQVGFHTVRFMAIPPEADKEYMQRFGPIADAMWEDPKYTNIEDAIKAIQSRLTMEGDVIEFDLLPGQKDGFLKAFAYFLTPEQAKAACTRLHGWRPASIGKARINAYHRQEVCYTLPSAAYAKISDDIIALKQSIIERVGQRIKLTIIQKGPPGISTSPVKIRLAGDELKDIVQYKTEFEKILRGEVVRENGRLMWDGYFSSRYGSSFIHDLERTYRGVCIEIDVCRRAIVLYGSAEKREPVRQQILEKARELRRAQVFHLDIPAEQLPGLCRSPDIHKLQDELGIDNIWLELINRRLVVRGDSQTFEMAKEAVRRTQERRLKMEANRPFSIASCPACFDEVTLPITLRCGHSWCRECLSNYLLAASNGGSFPLTCFGNQGKCSEPIPLGIARECLQAHDFEALIRACFFSYVHSRPKEFYYCPTPDCQEIYRTAPKGTVLQCPSCLQRICPFCHVEYHEGAPCPDRDEDDKLFNKWMKDHDVKNCPGCRVPIERGEGCNHITCIRCQTHICWVCLETFPKGDGIYEHMRTMHGGIGLRADGL